MFSIDLTETIDWSPGNRRPESAPDRLAGSVDKHDDLILSGTDRLESTRMDSGRLPNQSDSEFELLYNGTTKVKSGDRLHGQVISVDTGNQTNDYRLSRLLGYGGMGFVYLAKLVNNPVRSNRACGSFPTETLAIKIARRADHRRTHSRFQTEASILSQLQHQNIIDYYSSGVFVDQRSKGRSRSREYIALRPVLGSDIVSYLTERNSPLSKRVQLFIKLCSAVSYCHQKNVIHRDIKPANVIVDLQTGEPVLIDFGIARSNGPRCAAPNNLSNQWRAELPEEQLVGTLQYMSPEQTIPGQPGIDHRTDIYSLGLLLYEIINGSPLLDRSLLQMDSLDRILTQIASQRIPGSIRLQRLSDLPEEATQLGLHARIIEKCLELDPADRFQTVNQLTSALKQVTSRDCSFESWQRNVTRSCIHSLAVDGSKPEIATPTEEHAVQAEHAVRTKYLDRSRSPYQAVRRLIHGGPRSCDYRSAPQARICQRVWQAVSICLIATLLISIHSLWHDGDRSTAKRHISIPIENTASPNSMCNHEGWSPQDVPEPRRQTPGAIAELDKRGCQLHANVGPCGDTMEVAKQHSNDSLAFHRRTEKIEWMTGNDRADCRPCIPMHQFKLVRHEIQSDAIRQVTSIICELENSTDTNVGLLIPRITSDALRRCFTPLSDSVSSRQIDVSY